jgi:D-alanyl-D-alanine dipeptidase
MALSACAPQRIETRQAGCVDAAAVVPALLVEMRYAGSDNFVGRPIDGYEAPVCLLTHEAAAALAEVQRALMPWLLFPSNWWPQGEGNHR